MAIASATSAVSAKVRSSCLAFTLMTRLMSEATGARSWSRVRFFLADCYTIRGVEQNAHHDDTVWLVFLCLHLIWPGSQTSRCRCGVAHVLRFQHGRERQELVDVGVSGVAVWSGLEVTVKEQQGRWVNHETGEGEMERDDTCAMNLFRHLSLACMCTRMKMCECAQTNCATEKMCVRQVSVCTPPVVHTAVAIT